MLHLWLSTDRKLNTNRAFGLMREKYERTQEEQIILVPEQFSHLTQQAFCRFAGDKASRMAQVLDFTRLAERVFCQEGGIAETQTNAAGQLLMMALAVEQVRSRLKIYAMGAVKPEFLLQLLEMFEEFRSYCVTPTALRIAAGELGGLLAQKAEEFALLMESYEAVCSTCGQNPKSRLSRLLETLQESDFGKNEQFYFDGFTDFNGVQLQIIGELLEKAAEVHIFLQCDDLQRGGQQFEAARDTAKRLMRLSGELHVPYRVETVQAVEKEDALTYLRTNFFGGPGKPYPSEQSNVKFIEGNDALAQCRAAAGEILRLSANGIRWRDVSVVCPDYESYRPMLASVLHRADIPAYFAGDSDIMKQPVVQMLLTSLEAAAGYLEQETVLAYMKSDYCPLPRDRTDRLENYILMWNITASRFSQEWIMHPNGAGKDFDEAAWAELAALNSDRLQAITPLLSLRDGLKNAKTTADMVVAFYQFTRDIALEKKLQQQAEACRQEGQLQKAQEYVQLYGILCDLLEQIYGVLGGSVRSPDDFCAMFRIALSRCSVGTIPARLDCVSVGNLLSQRRSDTPYVFILGANEGCFPTNQSSRSLLTDPERSCLMSVGLGVSPTAAGRLERELAAIDSVLNAPSECLYLGACAGTESYFLRRARALFPKAEQCVEGNELLCRSEREYLGYLVGATAEGNEIPSLRERAISLTKAKDYAPQKLSEEAVGALYGKTLRLSSTKIDKLASCRMAYFLEYGLQAKERKSVEADALFFGTFVHYVLEQTTKQVQKEGGFHRVSLQRTLEIARGWMESYAQKEFRELFQTERVEHLFRRNFAEVEMVIGELHEELSKAEFEPRWFELNFSDRDGDLPAIQIVGEKMTAKLEGKVDRADLWRQGEKLYVRVIDYKTGKKKFDYSNILHGLGMQMLLYLFTIERSGSALMGSPMLPAGVLYFPARMERVNLKNKHNQEELENGRRESLRRSGLVLDEEAVLQAMEACDHEPVYLPYGYDKEGNRKGSLVTAERMSQLAELVFSKVAELGDELYSGKIDPNPYFFDSKSNACAYCPYSTVCRTEKKERWLKSVKNAEEFWQEVEKNA